MLLAGVVVLARGSVFMLGPVLEFDGERLAQYRRLESLPGPQDRRRAAEDSSATLGQTLSLRFCEKAPEDQAMLDVWFGGAQLICPENPPSAVLADYPSVHVGREKAGKELDRLASRRGISSVRRRCAPAGSPRLPFRCDSEGR